MFVKWQFELTLDSKVSKKPGNCLCAVLYLDRHGYTIYTPFNSLVVYMDHTAQPPNGEIPGVDAPQSTVAPESLGIDTPPAAANITPDPLNNVSMSPLTDTTGSSSGPSVLPVLGGTNNDAPDAIQGS